METTYRRYPIGIQNFEDLRNNNCVYIDKTELIYKLTHSEFVCFFNRPPKFGKSLLISTIEAYFQGKKELFRGLAIEKLEKEWTEYPVIRLGFDDNASWNVESLQMALELQLSIWEKKYGIYTNLSHSISVRFTEILRQINESTGKKVVLLIDGYDTPMWQQKNLMIRKELHDVLSQIFRPIKGCGKYLKFVFITGLSQLNRADMTGELNNLQNISMRDEYSALCGITEKELLTDLRLDIQRMAEANKETYEEACAHLKKQYDGYHFRENSEDIYNPFSLFNALNAKKYKNYWFSTGTPTFLIELLQNVQFDVRMMDGMTAMDDQFDAPTEVITDPIPVLYQSGYLTIKSFDPMFKIYTLAYPNNEVRYAFTEALLPRYVHRFPRENTFYIVSFLQDLMKGDIESCLERTRSFFASIPHDLENKTEKHYQTIFYLLFRLMGQYVDVEVKSAIGRADVVLKLSDAIYVFEFKYDGTPDEALAQIDSKQYAIPYQSDGRRIVKIGVNFDSATRTIGEWKIVTS